MRQRVEAYIKRCLSCQKNKHATHAKYGEIQYQEPPESPWDEVSMDFITKLPKSKDPTTGEAYDAILVMVDRLTKYCHIVPFKETYDAEKLGYIVLDRLIRYQGIPKGLTSDRDKLFTSNYWKTLIPLLGTKLRMSTAYHPQTDGQTERTNQSLEQYLRHYVNNSQNNWVSLLPMAQLALNAKVSDTTKVTPFFANFGREPNLFGEPKNRVTAQLAQERVETLKKVQENISKMQRHSAKYQNKGRKMAPLLKEGDKAYLLTKNLKISKGRSKKLDPVKVGPFFIKTVKGPVNYELDLPPDAKIFPTFHISYLEPADPDTPVQTTFRYEPQEETEYEVEEILEQRGQQYLVKWKGYPTSENTWEPVSNLTNCSQKLEQFREQDQARSGTNRRKYRAELFVPRQHR